MSVAVLCGHGEPHPPVEKDMAYRALPGRLLLGAGAALGLLDKPVDGLLEGRGVGAGKAIDLLALLEDEEGGDGADAELEGQVGDVVSVEAGKGERVRDGGGASVVGVLVVERRDGLAGAAPGRGSLEDDVGVCGEEVVEVGLCGDCCDGHGGGGSFRRGGACGMLGYDGKMKRG